MIIPDLLISGSKYAGRAVDTRIIINRAVAGKIIINPKKYYLFCFYYYYYRRYKTAGEKIGEDVTNIKLNILENKNTVNSY
jgi:hypothetical protein